MGRSGSDARKPRRTVLLLPEEDGGSTSERASVIRRALRARHEVVGVRCPWDRLIYDPARSRWLRGILYLLDKAGLTVRCLRAIRRHGLDVVFCETAHHALAGLLASRIAGARCIWDSHGNGRRLYESLGKGALSIRFVTALERFLGRRVDALLTVSEADAAAYRAMGLPASRITVLPVSVDLGEVDRITGPPPPPSAGASPVPVLLFFGSFRYEPNREALEFVNGVLAPFLEAHDIPCEIRVAGRDIPDLPFHPTVRPIGFVPNIHACIREATLCIVPVWTGVGVLTKVIDAMAVGTPLVLSDFAARGIPDIRDGVHAHVAATPEEFPQRVVAGLRNPDAARALAARARRLVESRFDWRAHAPLLDAIVDGPIPIHPAGGADEGRTHHAGR